LILLTGDQGQFNNYLGLGCSGRKPVTGIRMFLGIGPS
jgi:hypothetical protein